MLGSARAERKLVHALYRNKLPIPDRIPAATLSPRQPSSDPPFLTLKIFLCLLVTLHLL